MSYRVDISEENINKMKFIWENENITSNEIAKIFGITKGSVVGLAYRNKWIKKPKQKKEVVKKEKTIKDQKPKKKGKKKMNENYFLIPNLEMRKIKLIHAKENDCRHIIGEPRDMIICGNKTMEGKSYCSHHCAVNFCMKDHN